MIFRLGKKGDEQQVLRLIQQVLAPYGLQLEVDQADLDVTDLEHYYLNNKGWFQVVEVDDEIIGSVGVYKVSDKVCELRKMYLYSQFQGQGIGKKLMENALDMAYQLGYEEMTLQTNSLLVKALPLYEKYNFTVNQEEEVCRRCDLAMKRSLK